MAYKKKEVTPTEPEVKEVITNEVPPLPERFRGNKTIEGVWKYSPHLWELYK